MTGALLFFRVNYIPFYERMVYIMKKSIRTIDKIVRGILGFIGTVIEIPILIVRYMLGLIWVVYSIIRNRKFKMVFSSLNKNMIQEIKWLIDEFKFYTF